MDKAERRLALLSAARDVFATKGYHDAKVDDIVTSAKVAKGTFYLYFPDKRSVFAELVDSLFQRIGAAILEVDTDADVEAQVKHNIRAIVAVLLEESALTRILFFYAAGLDPAFEKTIHAFYDGVKKLLRESLAEGQRLGIVAEGDPRFFATFTIGALKEILFENVAGDIQSAREEIVSEMFRFLSGGYLRINKGEAPPPTARAGGEAKKKPAKAKKASA